MSMDDMVRGLKELREAQPGYATARKYYEGNTDDRFVSAIVRRALSRTNTAEDYAINLAGRPVDAVMDRLSVNAITSDSDLANQVIATTLAIQNQFWIEVPEVIKSTIMYGDCYLYVGPGVDGELALYEIPPTQGRAFYDEDNPRVMSYFIKSWKEGRDKDSKIRVNLYYPDRIEKYISRQGGKVTADPSAFEVFVDSETDENGMMEWSYGQIPFFHFRTGRPYGKPVHFKAYGSQNALTRLVSNLMLSAEFAAAPQRYISQKSKTDTPNNGEEGLSGAELAADYDSVTEETSVNTNMTAEAGSVWAFWDVDKIGEFAAADPDHYLKPMATIVRTMAAITDTPIFYFDPVGDAPSGLTLRALELPLVKKVQGFQNWLGATWLDAVRFALEKVLEVDPGNLTIQWASPQAMEDAEFWLSIQAQQDAGVPISHSLISAGIPEPLVKEWEKTREAEARMRQAMRGKGVKTTVSDDSVDNTVKDGQSDG